VIREAPKTGDNTRIVTGTNACQESSDDVRPADDVTVTPPEERKDLRMHTRVMSYRFYSETIMLALIAYADTVSTLWLVNSGLAVEANPLMAFYLQQGALWFIGIKLLMIMPAFAVDLNRARNPRRVRLGLRAALCLYIGVYLFGTLAQTIKLLAG
jgi:hypothetical protein